jgi:hypothetical protein
MMRRSDGEPITPCGAPPLHMCQPPVTAARTCTVIAAAISSPDGRGSAPDPGPAPGLSLADCHASGCDHLECARAALAHERLTPPLPAAGTVRRLRALALNAFGPGDLARRLGEPARVVRRLLTGKPRQVPAGLAAGVLALYDDLWDLTGSSPKTAAAARARNWCPALGWDEDKPGDDGYAGHGIDDPDAVPAPGWQRHPQRTRLTLDEQAAELADLVRLGLSVNQAAMRLGMSGNALQRVRDRLAMAS